MPDAVPRPGAPAHPDRRSARLPAIVLGAVAAAALALLATMAALDARHDGGGRDGAPLRAGTGEGLPDHPDVDRHDLLQLRTELRTVSVAMEVYAVDQGQGYPTRIDDLVELGAYRPHPEVDVTIVRADSGDGRDGYCLTATLTDRAGQAWLEAKAGAFSEEPCT